MCLSIPAKVIEIEGESGTVECEGTRVEAIFSLLTDVSPGDYVLVHAGFAIQKYTPAEARELLDLWRRVREQSS